MEIDWVCLRLTRLLIRGGYYPHLYKTGYTTGSEVVLIVIMHPYGKPMCKTFRGRDSEGNLWAACKYFCLL